ncbi:hypothetical protein, partial [Moorena sp. SIO3F7]|uniref:hypothetical protein n=1 Tax=Moorena sp. SIO3F7 TaxID=2607839 RepID=UPI0013FFE4AA
MAGTGMLVAWACWWHGHVGGMGMLLWNGHVGGMGMLVAWACWWHGHVGGMGTVLAWLFCRNLQFARYPSLASRRLRHHPQF